mgnify:FL=1
MQKTEYKNIGETLYACTLPNGLRVRVLPKPGFNSFYAVFATNYGGAHRAFTLDGQHIDTPAGVAHFLEHKMFDLPGGDNALNILTANGADPNAFTSSGMTAYYFECTENFEQNLRMLLHFVSTPYFTPETVQKEQGIIAQEIRMGEDNPGVVLYYDLLRMLYKSHPIRDRVAGTVESIAEITDKTLYDCHRAFYSGANMVLCIAGDVGPERMSAIAFEELPSTHTTAPTADLPDDGELPFEQYKRTEMPVSAPQFFIGAKLRPETDGEAALRQRLIAMLAMRLLCGYSSPFYARLYAEGLLNRDFDYEVDFTAGTATIIIGGESAEPERVRDELTAEVGRIVREGFAADAFERARRASLGARLRGLEDFDNVCLSIAEGVFDGYDALSSAAVLETVTKDECESFVREKLAAERLALAVIAPGKE